MGKFKIGSALRCWLLKHGARPLCKEADGFNEASKFVFGNKKEKYEQDLGIVLD